MLEKVCREKEGGIGKKKSFPVTASEKGKNSARTPKMGGMGEGTAAHLSPGPYIYLNISVE